MVKVNGYDMPFSQAVQSGVKLNDIGNASSNNYKNLDLLGWPDGESSH